jgi:hypothetical protein
VTDNGKIRVDNSYKIFLPSDLRMMGGQESERDQVWATEDGILHILIQ